MNPVITNSMENGLGLFLAISTIMAAALGHDVMDYCNRYGSAVYACSHAGEAAFDVMR